MITPWLGIIFQVGKLEIFEIYLHTTLVISITVKKKQLNSDLRLIREDDTTKLK